MGNGEGCKVQPRRGLTRRKRRWNSTQNILRRERFRRAMSESEGVLQELDDFGLGLQVRRTVAVRQPIGELVARNAPPDVLMGECGFCVVSAGRVVRFSEHISIH